jgi:LacI family gluconate utilization system Gnt-I transcriptional repressor
VEQDYRAHERGQGFLDASRQAGAKVSLKTAKALEPMTAGRLVIQSMPASKRPQAIAFANDHLAVGALLQAHDEHIIVPAELALLGFGDFPIACQLDGGISTLAAPRYQIGQECGRCILNRLKPATLLASTTLASVCLNPSLIIRNTTRQPNPIK